MLFTTKSNILNEPKITEIFNLVYKIRQRGINKMKEQNLTFLPEAPVIDVTAVYLPLDEENFRSALGKIGPIFEICLSIKTSMEISRELKRLADKRAEPQSAGFICPRCQREFPKQKDVTLRFCPTCGTRVKTHIQKRNPPISDF